MAAEFFVKKFYFKCIKSGVAHGLIGSCFDQVCALFDNFEKNYPALFNEAIQFIFKFIFSKGGFVMSKFNLRGLFLVLSVVILLIVSVGCNHTNDNISDDNKGVQSSEVQQNSGTELSRLFTRAAKKVTTENDGVVSFSAKPYVQAPELSWVYSFDIKIEDGKIYINGILYEESSSTPPAVLFSKGFLAHVDYTDKVNNTEIASTLTKIKNCESCYRLETKQDSPAGQKISVYEIDNCLYFIRFFDNGEVMRIHYAPIT